MRKEIKLLTAFSFLLASNHVVAQNIYLSDVMSLIGTAKEIVSDFDKKDDNQIYPKDISTLSKPPFHKFYSAKKEISKHLDIDAKTFYLGCNINKTGRGKIKPDLRSCNYQTRGNSTRSRRIEYEHIVPVSWASSNFDCWKNGGRKNCQKKSRQFQSLEADPVNLVPTIGEVNGDRSNYKFAQLNHGFSYGSNGLVLFDKESKRFKPPHDKKGWIARVHLYMEEKYNINFSSSYKRMISVWAEYPATKEECNYNSLTKSWGFENKFSTKSCKQTQL